MTTNINIRPLGRPLHRMPTYESLVEEKKSGDLNTHLTSIRNSSPPKPPSSESYRWPATTTEASVFKPETPPAPSRRNYPSVAELRKAADDSVAQHVFPLVHSGQFSAAKALMLAYRMSPDARLGPSGWTKYWQIREDGRATSRRFAGFWTTPGWRVAPKTHGCPRPSPTRQSFRLLKPL